MAPTPTTLDVTASTVDPTTVPVVGGPVVIGGSGLSAATGVDFGGFPAAQVVALDDATLYATAPARNPGTVAVVVHTPTADLTVAGGLTYQAASVVVDWPTLPEVRAYLRIPTPNTVDDPIIDQARRAAIDYGNRRTNYQWTPGSTEGWLRPLPWAAHEAAVIHAARMFRRRDSIDGTVGWADVGLTHVGRVDPDVEALYALVGPWVFG